MDYKYIEQLLEKYWNCETSVEEERILHSFFRQEDIPAHLRAYQHIFVCLGQQGAEKLDAAFDKRVLEAIGKKAEKDTVQCIPLKLYIRFRPFYKAAGMIGILLAIGMAAQHSFQPSDLSEGTPACAEQYADPDAPFTQMPDAPEQQSASLISPTDTIDRLQMGVPRPSGTPTSQAKKGL